MSFPFENMDSMNTGDGNVPTHHSEDSFEGDQDYVKEFIERLPKSQQECLKVLETLHARTEELQAGLRKELRDLDRSTEASKAPMYERRAKIISGEDSEAVEMAEGAEVEPLGLPGFWLKAMKNCACMRDNITSNDEVVLQHLTNISTSTLEEEEGVGFRLEFFFKPNEFFTNEKLTKTYFMADSDYHEVERAQGTVIEWKEGKNVTVRTTKKKQRKKNSTDTRTVIKTEPCESFFNFFSPPEIPAAAPGGGGIDEEEREIREQELEADHEVGLSFHEHVVPRAILWFTGQADDDASDADDDSGSGGTGSEDGGSDSGGSAGSDSMHDSEEDADGMDEDDDDDDFSVEGERRGRRRGAAAVEAAVNAFIATLSEGQQRRVLALQALHEECEALQVQFRASERRLDRKYEELKAPIYAMRARIVTGAEVPPAAAEAAAAEAAAAAAGDAAAASAAAGIPGFWLEAMQNCARVRRRVTERDEEALRLLRDVRCVTLPDGDGGGAGGEAQEGVGPGFRLEFEFGPNPFFANETLVRTFYMTDSEFLEPVRATGTAIQWRDGRNLTVRMVRRRRRGRGGRGTRTVQRAEPCDSFFNFFREIVVLPPRGAGGGGGGGGGGEGAAERGRATGKAGGGGGGGGGGSGDDDGEDEDDDGGGDDGEDDSDEEERERLAAELEDDFDVGTSFKEHLVPAAVRWFTGEADDDSDDGGDSDSGGGGGESGESDGDDDGF